MNQAYFREWLNLAAVRRLPIVYACENNLYGEWTPMEKVTAGGQIAPRADAYGIPASDVDGKVSWPCARRRGRRSSRARDGGGPTFLNAAPTATRATRGSTRASTGPKRKSRTGLHGIRCRA